MSDTNQLPFEMDSEGRVLTKPITGWSILPVAGSGLLFVLRYAESEEELEVGKKKSIQFALTAAGAIALSEGLKTEASALLDDQSHWGAPAN